MAEKMTITLCWDRSEKPSTDYPELNQETTKKYRPESNREIKSAHGVQDLTKDLYSDLKQKPMEFEVGLGIMLNVTPLKWLLELPQKLSKVHHTFHVSNLKKCYADKPLVIEDKLQFLEEPVEIIEWEIKRLKRSRIPLVKVCWNSKRGPEFTWECEESFK
ncbi:hypothetical protein Tco_0536600 [Tanacetum coccineum]